MLYDTNEENAREIVMHEAFQGTTVYEVAYAVWKVEARDDDACACLTRDAFEASTDYALAFDMWQGYR